VRTNHEEMLTLLRENLGFDEPEDWLAYALQHHFTRVAATPIPRCPDCGALPRRQLGQHVYYSTLMHLVECSGCGLIWMDAQLPHHLIRQHFDLGYKDEVYFERSRRLIVRRLAEVIVRAAPRHGSVLDVGGAKGHLLAEVRKRRPDLHVVLNDLSQVATRRAEELFRLETIEGDLSVLAEQHARYDVVVLSDVLYYIPELHRAWTILSDLIKRGGCLVLRVPNAAPRITFAQALRRRFHRGLDDRIPHLNSEHMYVFTRRYLRRRLAGLGFDTLIIPSPLLCGPLGRSAVSLVTQLLHQLSRGWLLLSPSMIIVARKGG
jgi:SAM-dependent methyltransferase